MEVKLPKYTHAYTDRNGTKRYYLRRAGHKSIPLPGTVFSPEFMAAHAMALNGRKSMAIAEQRPARGSISQLIAAYMQSGKYINFKENTRKARYNMLQKAREQFGQVNIEAFTPQVAYKLLSKFSPANQFAWKTMFRGLFEFGINTGLCDKCPVKDFKPDKRDKNAGYYTWSEDDIAKFRAFHPLGSQARLIMEIMLCCGCRISDALRLGPQHIRVNRDGEKEVFFRAKKNSEEIDLLLDPELEEAIAAMGPPKHLTFMVKRSGAVYRIASYSNRFKKFCRDAGLPPEASAHGCRKGFSTRISNAGGSEHAIMAAIGDTSPAMARKYTERRNKSHLAKQAQRAVRAMLREGRA